MTAANADSDVKALAKFIRQISLHSAAELSKLKVSVAEISNLADVFIEWTAVIHLLGPHFKLAFQIHFPTDLAKEFAGAAFGSKPKTLTTNEAADFMMEVANIATGRVKRAVSLNGVQVQMSLPMVVGEYGEEATNTAKWQYTDKWKVVSEKGALAFSFYIEADQPFVLKDPGSLNTGDVVINI